jgi:hypothetical protein
VKGWVAKGRLEAVRVMASSPGWEVQEWVRKWVREWVHPPSNRLSFVKFALIPASNVADFSSSSVGTTCMNTSARAHSAASARSTSNDFKFFSCPQYVRITTPTFGLFP